MLGLTSTTLAQDASNIKYVRLTDTSILDPHKKVHIDFYRRSFGGKDIDTVFIAITNRTITFIEHRVDNGLNNQFDQQYLESVDSINNLKLRLAFSYITQTTRDEIQVINYFNLYDQNGHQLFDKPFTSPNSYRRKSIAEILILSE